MKKILLLLILMILSMPLCFAEGEEEEDISQYFTDNNQSEQLQGKLEYNATEDNDLIEENAVNLENDSSVRGIQFSQPKTIGAKSVTPDSRQPSFLPLETGLNNASKFSTQEFAMNPVSTSFAHKVGKFTFGTKYDSSIDSASASYTTALFSKYEWKHFALSTSFSKNTSINDDSFSDKIYIVPELKITKRLSLLDVMQTDTNQINKKNEIVLRYTPKFGKYADDVQLEVGAGQSFYQDQFVKSTLRFSTTFKL